MPICTAPISEILSARDKFTPLNFINGKKQIRAKNTRKNAKNTLSTPFKNSPIKEKLNAQISVTMINLFKFILLKCGLYSKFIQI